MLELDSFLGNSGHLCNVALNPPIYKALAYDSYFTSRARIPTNVSNTNHKRQVLSSPTLDTIGEMGRVRYGARLGSIFFFFSPYIFLPRVENHTLILELAGFGIRSPSRAIKEKEGGKKRGCFFGVEPWLHAHPSAEGLWKQVAGSFSWEDG